MNKFFLRVISPLKSLFVCLVTTFAMVILLEEVFMLDLTMRILFIPHLGVILFLSFWVLAESAHSPSFPHITWFLYVIMMAIGLLLAKPLLIDLRSETAHSPQHSEKQFAPNQKGGFTWHIRLEDAKKVALKNEKPILIYFSADWCLPCREMEERFFPSKKFKKFAENHRMVLLLYDMNQDNPEGEKVANENSVKGLPTMIVADHKGKIIDKVLGFRSTDKTIRELEEVMDLFKK